MITKQITSAQLIQPSEKNNLKAPVVVVKFVGSDLPSYFTPSYFDGLCLKIGLMSAMVFSSPAAFQISAEFVIRKEGETYTKSDNTEGVASSTSLRVSKATIGMNISAFGAVMAATAANLAQPQTSSASNSDPVDENMNDGGNKTVDKIPEKDLVIGTTSTDEPS